MLPVRGHLHNPPYLLIRQFATVEMSVARTRAFTLYTRPGCNYLILVEMSVARTRAFTPLSYSVILFLHYRVEMSVARTRAFTQA